MRKSVTLLLILVFLTASCTVSVKPALSSADDLAENAWISKAPMQVARSNLGVAVANGKIYAIGGTSESGPYAPVGEQFIGGIVGINEEYDPTTDTWSYKKSMPTGREDFAIASYQNKIYCIGGISNSGSQGVNEVYDPATDTWEIKEPLPMVVDGVEANVVEGKIYLFGRYFNQESSASMSNNISGSYHFGIMVYDPAKDSWTTKASLPFADAPYVSATVNNMIYVIGEKSIQIYDTETDTWHQGSPTSPLNSRYTAAVATAGLMAPKRIYALGLTEYNEVGAYLAEEVQAYDTEKDGWKVAANIPTERFAFGATVLNDTIYVVGGRVSISYYSMQGSETCATVEQYTPFGYGKAPPLISIASPEGICYDSRDVSLNFMVNKPFVWLGYSLDGQDNVTFSGNVSLSGLSSGLHNITVYAKDSSGNVGASETIHFSVEEPFPTTLIAVAATIVVLVSVVLLVFFKKRKR